MPVEDINAPPVKGIVKAPTGVDVKPEPTFVDDILKIRRQKKAEEIVEKEMGSRDEGIAATIIKASIERDQSAAARADKMIDRKDDEAIKARAEATEAKEDLYKVMFQQMGAMQAQLGGVLAEIRKGAEPKSATMIVKEANEFLEAIGGRKPTDREVQAPVMDAQTQIQLKKIEMDHQLAIKQIELQMSQMNQLFQIKMAEFEDERRRKDREYEDGKVMRGDALGSLHDIAAGIAQGIKVESTKESSNVRAEVAAAATAKEKEPAYDVVVQSFPCDKCGTTLAVPKEGNMVTCPSCKYQYEVTRGA